jgi:hypothetical protein
MNYDGSTGLVLIPAADWVCLAVAPQLRAVRNKSPPPSG